jgi:hypothetical protein
MNKAQKKLIADLSGQLSDILNQLGDIKGEEQDKLDRLPENMQGGEKAEAYENAVSVIDDCESEIENTISSLDALIEG